MNVAQANEKRKTCKLCQMRPGYFFCRKHTPKATFSTIKYQLIKEKLFQFPSSEVGKTLRYFTPKEGVTFENIVISYLDFISNNMADKIDLIGLPNCLCACHKIKNFSGTCTCTSNTCQ